MNSRVYFDNNSFIDSDIKWLLQRSVAHFCRHPISSKASTLADKVASLDLIRFPADQAARKPTLCGPPSPVQDLSQ